jgi:uncharacterized membrane protein (DUF106 family)
MDISTIPTATVSIMLIALIISFVNMTINRLLISRMVGWKEYQAMQKEMREYQSEMMKAARANDKKMMEKLKKKDSQIKNMQAKMLKPQMFLFLFTVVYFVIWPILNGYFPHPVAYVPGIGQIPFFYWYLVCSFFFGTLAGRILGIQPIA